MNQPSQANKVQQEVRAAGGAEKKTSGTIDASKSSRGSKVSDQYGKLAQYDTKNSPITQTYGHAPNNKAGARDKMGNNRSENFPPESMHDEDQNQKIGESQRSSRNMGGGTYNHQN